MWIGHGSTSDNASRNRQNLGLLRGRILFKHKKSFHDIRDEYNIAAKGTFKYNETTTSEIIATRKKVVQNRRNKNIKTAVFVVAIITIAFYYLFNALVVNAQSASPQKFTQTTKIAQSHDALIHSIDSIVKKYDTYSIFNGIICIAKKEAGPVIYKRGWANPLELDKEMNENDIFHLASNSKLFTGLAVLKLMEEHEIKSTDSIGAYFPELKPAMQRVTIQQLANHTNGIHDYLSLTKVHHQITNQDVIKLLAPIDSTVFEPDSRWGYSNSGYVLLAMLIERVSGVNYNEYLREKVLKPMGLQHLQLKPDNIECLPGFRKFIPYTSYGSTSGPSGIYASTNDMIRFYSNQHLIKEYIHQAKELASPWHEPAWQYGFGWFFSKDAMGEFRAHSGRAEGFEAYIRIYMDESLMLLILTNNESPINKPIRQDILNLLNEMNE